MPRRILVGIDVGGTFTKVAAVSDAGRIVAEERLPSEVPAGPAAFVERVAGVLERWKTGRRLLPKAVGLGIAGDVDNERGMIRFTPNLRGWDGFDFKRALSRRLKSGVVVENDANAAVWGGYMTELRAKPRHVVGITLGTGVGGGLVLDGRLHRGATGSAGEIGHTQVESDGEPCNCGRTGCLEAYAGTYGIVRLTKRLLEADPARGAALRRLCPDLSKLEPRHLSEAADAGDAVACEVWHKAGTALGVGVANLVLVLNPEVVLILGGVSRAGRWVLDPVERVLAAQPFRTPFSKVRLKMADKPDIGCVGAALLAREAAR